MGLGNCWQVFIYQVKIKFSDIKQKVEKPSGNLPLHLKISPKYFDFLSHYFV